MRITPFYKPLLIRALLAGLVLTLILTFHLYYNRLHQAFLKEANFATAQLISTRYTYEAYIKAIYESPPHASLYAYLKFFLLLAIGCTPIGFIFAIALPGDKRKTLLAEVPFWIAIPIFWVLGSVVFASLTEPYFWNKHPILPLMYITAFYVWFILFTLWAIRYFLGAKPDSSILSQFSVKETLPLLADGSPDWANLQSEVYCPICSYNLRGLPSPRCPECGYPFQWAELRPRSNSWLNRFFEYANHNLIRSFFFTWLRAFIPGRFYSHVSASHPIHKRRVMFTLLLLIMPAIPLHIFSYAAPSAFNLLNSVGYWISGKHTFIDLITDTLKKTNISIWIIFPLTLLFWIVFSIFSIFFLRQTARKAKINLWHIVRCVTYSAVPFLPLSAIAPLFKVFIKEFNYSLLHFTSMDYTLSLCLVLLWPIVLLALSAKHYLRIPRAVFTVLTLQLIFLIALICVPVISF